MQIIVLIVSVLLLAGQFIHSYFWFLLIIPIVLYGLIEPKRNPSIIDQDWHEKKKNKLKKEDR